MPTYQILYWYEIPTQVRVREGRERVSKPLSPRFMEAVDSGGHEGSPDQRRRVSQGLQVE